jgi:hypothetical protein
MMFDVRCWILVGAKRRSRELGNAGFKMSSRRDLCSCRYNIDTGYWMLAKSWMIWPRWVERKETFFIGDGRDLFPLKKEPVLSEAEGGVGGCFDLDVRNVTRNVGAYRETPYVKRGPDKIGIFNKRLLRCSIFVP